PGSAPGGRPPGCFLPSCGARLAPGQGAGPAPPLSSVAGRGDTKGNLVEPGMLTGPGQRGLPQNSRVPVANRTLRLSAVPNSDCPRQGSGRLYEGKRHYLTPWSPDMDSRPSSGRPTLSCLLAAILVFLCLCVRLASAAQQYSFIKLQGPYVDPFNGF